MAGETGGEESGVRTVSSKTGVEGAVQMKSTPSLWMLSSGVEVAGEWDREDRTGESVVRHGGRTRVDMWLGSGVKGDGTKTGVRGCNGAGGSSADGGCGAEAVGSGVG